MKSERHSGTELGRYLRARRARVTPADVGLAAGSGVRRTREHEHLRSLMTLAGRPPLDFARAGGPPSRPAARYGPA